MIQGGDFTEGDVIPLSLSYLQKSWSLDRRFFLLHLNCDVNRLQGTGGISICGSRFEDESFDCKSQIRVFCLSMNSNKTVSFLSFSFGKVGEGV